MVTGWLPLKGRWLQYAVMGGLAALILAAFLDSFDQPSLAWMVVRFGAPLLSVGVARGLWGRLRAGWPAQSDRVEDGWSRCRVPVLLLATVVLLFLPPPVTAFRSPPPTDLLPHWWCRYFTASLLIYSSGFALVRQKQVTYATTLLLLVLVVSAHIGASLFEWVSEFPYLFRIPSSLSYWWSH